MLNGGLGFSGSNPVIQVAGAQRIIESDPRQLYISGNYNNVPTMWVSMHIASQINQILISLYLTRIGTTKQEGTVVLARNDSFFLTSI